MNYQTTVVILNERKQILAHHQGEEFSLPEVAVSPGRLGISLSRAVREQLHLEIFCLIVPEAERKGFHVLRLQSPEKAPRPGLAWTTAAELSKGGEVLAVLDLVDATANSFGGYLWYSDVAGWLDEQLGRFGYTIHRFEQWNGRIGGVLLRLVSNGPDLWFKAVSDFNVREMAVAQLLAAKHPLHFPRILATKSAWNALVLEHIEGTELYECEDLVIWNSTAKLLADVQMDWIGSSDCLLKAGGADLRVETMIAKIPEFLDHIDDAMARQPKTPPQRLTRSDLDELEDALYALSADVSALHFPEGLANADFSPHNTVITSQGPVFIDWAEACISFPLIAGEYMWNRMVVESPTRARWRSALRTAYLGRWAENYGMARVERAAELLPGFALFAVAMFYHERESHGPSPYDSYLRSLTRRLESAVKRTSIRRCAGQA